MKKQYLLILVLLLNFSFMAQSQDWEDNDSAYIPSGIEDYNCFCPVLGGDSIRLNELGRPQMGVYKDTFPTGELRHKGYYNNGILNNFKNYYTNGQLEREFKFKGNKKGIIDEYYENGQLKSHSEINKGSVFIFHQYFSWGKMKIKEEYDKGKGTRIINQTFFYNGNNEYSCVLIDKKKHIYEEIEYHFNGNVAEKGMLIYRNNDYLRTDIWNIYNESGKLVLKEEYYNGTLVNDEKF